MSKRAEPILTADGLKKTYRLGRVDVPVLKGAGLDVKPGEWVAILGASGSGKSTLLHLLGDLDHPDTDSGDALFRGRPIHQDAGSERNLYRNQRIGFVFQFYHLLPELTVLENTILPAAVATSLRTATYWLRVVGVCALIGIAVTIGGWFALAIERPEQWWGWLLLIAGGAVAGPVVGAGVWIEIRSHLLRMGPQYAVARERAIELLRAFGLEHRLAHRPRELSGGERQRVAIARALINQPDVLLADEPTGNLDERTGAEILDLIAAQHKQGLTIVMVTHDPKIADRADRVVELRDGKVV